MALDRGITIARRYGFPADLDKWETVRDTIKEEVLERGWNGRKQAFVQHYDTDALDSSCLLIPIFGFLPFDDPRVVSTVEAVRRELGRDGFLYRYRAEDGLPGSEGRFLICSFWLIDNLIGQGRDDEAERLLNDMKRAAGTLGLFSEEYNVESREALGNYPQALSHIGYVNSVAALCRHRAEKAVKKRQKTVSELVHQKLAVTHRYVLNRDGGRKSASSREIAFELKRLMNVLRGAFFNTAEGRVAYEEMSGSRIYREYVEYSHSLREMDLDILKTRPEQLAFWINMYNVIVIHGVIELGIRDSVKEVPRFFKRVQYDIGGMLFSAEDIEHGVLRGNHRFPRSPFRPFGQGDPRLKHAIRPTDPRIHFALVCASSSCPPIGVFTAENLDEELTVSGKTFLNTDGIRIDKDAHSVSLSQVFKWYAGDFGKTPAERLRFIAPYLYDEADRRFLEESADTVKVSYQDYDWRLNKY